MPKAIFSHSTKNVNFARWPAEKDVRVYRRRIPCLVAVPGGTEPPGRSGQSGDRVWPPIPREGLDARATDPGNRAYGRQTPWMDPAGTLHFHERSVTISNIQAELMKLFLDRFREVVCREDLRRCLADCASSPSRNSLDLHIMRLRKRLLAVDLGIKTAWGRGYLLEPWTPL